MMVWGTTSQAPKWTFIFMVVCVAGFVFQSVSDVWIYLAFIPAFALQMPWMFFTSVFLHAGISHLFFNMFALFFFGIYLERMVGRRLFIAIFVLSGVVGNVGHMFTSANPFIPTIGASGAVYGIIGTLTVLTPFLIVFVYGMMPLPLIAAAFLWALMDIAGLFTPSGIAHGAHLAGLFIGVAFGLYLRGAYRRRY